MIKSIEMILYFEFNPIPRGLKYNLLHGGGGAYMPPLRILL